MSDHLFGYDDTRSDVIVTTVPTPFSPRTTHAYRDTPTLTCAKCGLRLAHIAAPNGRVSPAYGIELDALVRTEKKLPACVPAKGAA